MIISSFPYPPAYLGPDKDSRDVYRCECNTVHYSLLAACALCQGYTDNEGILEWVLAIQVLQVQKI